MDIIRKHQKWIFWIIAILVIFSMTWYMVPRDRADGGGGDYYVFEIDGKRVDYNDFSNMQKRITAAIGEQPFKVTVAYPNDQIPYLWDYVWLSFIVSQAEKAGIVSSDAAVGTYLRSAHPRIQPIFQATPEKLEEAINNVCLRNQISKAEFMRGVREWLMISDYIELDNATFVPDMESAYTLYAFDKAEFAFKRVRIEPTDAIREQARKDVMEKPAEELERDVRDHIARAAMEPRYREPAKWRFGYIMVPFGTDTDIPAPSEEEITVQYDTYKSVNYDDKPLDEVRDQVVGDLAAAERERRALRNLTVDIDTQLRQHGGMDVAELGKLTQLVKYGVKTGVTGDEPLTAVEIATGSPISPLPALVERLTIFDNISPELRNNEVEMWKAGFLVDSNPMRTDEGLVRLKLLDYEPSAPVAIDDADGKIKPELFDLAVSDLVDIQVATLTHARAQETQQQLVSLVEARENGGEVDEETAALFDELPTETMNYRDMTANDAEFIRMGIGEVRGPLIVPTPRGAPLGSNAWDVAVLTERRVPNRASFESEGEDVRTRYLNSLVTANQGQVGYTIAGGGLMQAVQPSQAMIVAFWDKYMKNRVSINPELLVARDS